MALEPLDGIGIVEVGIIKVEGIAALLPSDYGAEVIHLEFPREEEEGNSQDYRVCDRGEMRVRSRPDGPDDRKWLGKLLTRIDVAVTSVPDIRMSQWSLDVDMLCSRNSGAIYISITGYGQTGPYGNGCLYDEATIQAESGFTSIMGPEHGDPVRNGSDFAIFVARVSAYIETLMALIDVQHTGKGRRVGVSMMDSVLYDLEDQFSAYLKSEHIPERLGNCYALSTPVGNFTCRDGKEIVILVATGVQWEDFVDVTGHPEWLENSDCRNVGAHLKNHRMLEKEVPAASTEYTSGKWMERLQIRKCTYGRINGFKEVARYEQVQARHMSIKITTPDGTKMTVPSNPLVMDSEKNTGTVVNDTMVCHNCTVD